MACTPEKMVSVPIMVKLNKISSYLSSFQADRMAFKRNSLLSGNADEQPERNDSSEETGTILSDHQNERSTTCPSFISDKIKDYYCTDVKVPSKHPLNNLRCRLKTFGDVSWMLPCNIVSVYDCVRRGWYLLQQDMLCCCSCNEMVCLQLPPSHSSSYDHAVSILRDRVLNKHKGNCRYRNCTEPVAIARPPSLLTTPHLYSLAAAAHQLASGASTAAGVHLPYIENGGKDAMDRLEVSSSMLQEVWGSVCDDGWQHIAVLLVLCGWKPTTVPDTIRCELCQRSIGLWHFLSYAEHHEREAAVAASVLSEMGKPTTEATGVAAVAEPDGNLDNSQATTELTEDLLQKIEDNSNASKPCDALIVAVNAEGGESEGNDGVEVGRAPADISCLDGDDVRANDCKTVEEGAASGDLSQGTVMEGDRDSKQKNIANQDEHNNITSSSGPDEETETRNKRKRSECEGDEQDQSKLESEANDECSKALHSKRSKSDEDSLAPAISEPLPASPDVSVEESTSSAVTQVASKPLFCPFTQHRYWCGWVSSLKKHHMTTSETVAFTTNSPSDHTSNGGPDMRFHAQDTFSEAHCDAAASSANDSRKGYTVFAHELKSVLQLAQKRQWTASDKYAKTIDGLRCVRAHLTSWAK